MVIVKASPQVDLRARLTPQRPPRQLDVFLRTYNAVYKNEVRPPSRPQWRSTL